MLYYDFDSIFDAGKKANCANLLIAGGKGNGKTFGALRKGLKIYLGLENPEHEGYIIRYCRRRKESIKQTTIKNLFRPHEKWIETVTDGKYNSTVCRGSRFYLSKIDGDKRLYTAKREFCVCNALSTWETDSGADEGEAGIIIFDEAISRETPLIDEFSVLMKYHNNCTRNRTNYYCPLVLIGNTVTRDCTIFGDFGVDLWAVSEEEEKKGHIQYVKNRKGQVNCIFEWCGNAEVQEKSKAYYDRFLNDKTKMITDGVFSVGEYRVMREQPAGTKSICKVCFVSSHHKIVADFLQYESGDIIIYMSAPEHVDGCDLYISPAAISCNSDKNMLNYFDNSAASVFRKCYITNNILYDSPKTGEKYRSFAMHCVGLASCIPE